MITIDPTGGRPAGALRLAVQKDGRLTDDTLSLLSACGLDFDRYRSRLFAPCRNFPLSILYGRDDDIPGYVATGVVDIGIVGSNMLIERQATDRVRERYANSSLAFVDLAGPGACRKGYRSCYYRALSGIRANTLSARIVEPRLFDPAEIYAASDDDTLERDTCALYTAYERLRDAPFVAGSRTTALLHAPDTQAISRSL